MNAPVPNKPLIPDATRLAQDQATNPRASAWVSANAGAGKTFVLARRVLRLLLEGHDPSSLLCLTFTKAAAAEMAARVFDELAHWTRLDDSDLREVLADLGAQRRSVDHQDMERARSLFARALETPGGLKIQTIHAFCESLLHQFPFEANVAASFTVLDDRDASALMHTARAETIARAAKDDGALGQAFDVLASEMAEGSLGDALDAVLRDRHALAQAFEFGGTHSVEEKLEQLLRKHADLLGLDIWSLDDIENALADPIRSSPTLPKEVVRAYWERAQDGTATDKKRIEPLWHAHTAATAEARREAYRDGLFTKDGKPRATGEKSLPRVAQTYPTALANIAVEQDRALALNAHRHHAALMRMALTALERFEALKSRKGLLDFDDLIARTAALLTRSGAAAWVRYKLDQKINHVLVDEAQDTSGPQWSIITALVDDFFDGEAARAGLEPTFFAVGDEKQSIYSFQGADPRHFEGTRRGLETKAARGQAAFEAGVQLSLSFRSTRDVLSAVDTVFSRTEALQGVSLDTGLVHEPFRRGRGLVELWPVIKGTRGDEPADWTAPVDSLPAPHLRLADAIAGRVETLLQSGAVPGDILILLRTRGAIADAINRKLKERSIAVAGADRLALTDHIAVEDMMALMQTVLLPEDDLSLATLLVSPLIGLSDVQLESLCVGRPGFLIDRLNAPTDVPAIRQAALDVARWRAMADYASPFTFLATVLGRDGGLKRMLRRLGEDARDPLDELVRLALNEKTRPGEGAVTLETFLDTLRRLSLEIKRDMEARGDKVRIMTVHGSKGLEAKTVFLVDTCRLPRAPSGLLAIDTMMTPDAPPLIYLRGSSLPPAYRTIKETEVAKQQEEYRRLLYVAMTRARDQLIITGHMPSDKEVPQGCWYDLVDKALAPDARDVGGLTGGLDGEPVRLWRAAPWPQQEGEETSREAAAAPVEAAALEALRALVSAPLKPVVLPTPLRPSKAQADSDLAGVEWEAKAQAECHRQTIVSMELQDAGVDARDPLAFGTLVHKLLERFSAPDYVETQEVARALGIENEAIVLEAHRHVHAVFDLPEADMLFGPNARSEVPVRGMLVDKAGETRLVSGSIDRLVVTSHEVVAIDFKTNANPPSTQGLAMSVPGYVAQMALYEQLLAQLFPTARIRCGLLWTGTPRLDWLDPKAMAESRQTLGLSAAKGPA
ncbi:MAG: double-strand break repair helicase AddA [Pseudomonadota bacterium]